eukprot:780935-Amphidinium_carterae.1
MRILKGPPAEEAEPTPEADLGDGGESGGDASRMVSRWSSVGWNRDVLWDAVFWAAADDDKYWDREVL